MGENSSGSNSIGQQESPLIDPLIEAKRPYFKENENKVTLVQAAIRQRLISDHYRIIVMLNRKRTRVAREIWNSETTYLEGLMTMTQLFQKPLEMLSSTPNQILTPEEISQLFSLLPALIDASKIMNSFFSKVCANFTPHSKIGEIFIEKVDLLKKAFTPYADNFDHISQHLTNLKKENEKFRTWLSGIEFKQCDLSLESYLIMPIQRVTRYGLLLKELIHQTWQDHADYESLLESLKTVELLAQHVNEHKRILINQDKIKMIQSQISGIKVDLTDTPSRVYVTEGMVKELDSSIPLTHYIFLFNDVMIWTQMINKKKFMFRKMNYLERTTAEPDKLNSLRVITDNWTICIYANNKEDQNKWLTYLENQNYSPEVKKMQKRPNVVFLNKQAMVMNQLKMSLNSQRHVMNTSNTKQFPKRQSGSSSKNSPELSKNMPPSKLEKSSSGTIKDKEKRPSKKNVKKLEKVKVKKIHAATLDPKVIAKHKELASMLKQNLEKRLKEEESKEKKLKRSSEYSPKSRKQKADSVTLTGTNDPSLPEGYKDKRYSENLDSLKKDKTFDRVKEKPLEKMKDKKGEKSSDKEKSKDSDKDKAKDKSKRTTTMTSSDKRDKKPRTSSVPSDSKQKEAV